MEVLSEKGKWIPLFIESSKYSSKYFQSISEEEEKDILIFSLHLKRPFGCFDRITLKTNSSKFSQKSI